MSPWRLETGEAHCWCVPLDVPPETSAACESRLSEEERARSARFRSERDRQRFVVAHAALRDLLGRYLETEAAGIAFTYNAFGKPALPGEYGAWLSFSLSHSGDLALIAVAPRAAVGVDVEWIRPQPDAADIARRFFSPVDGDALERVPSHLRAEAFLKRWTEKEAYLKARGEGLALLDGAPGDHIPGHGWSCFTLQPAPRYIGALVIEGRGWRLRQRTWPTLSLVPATA